MLALSRTVPDLLRWQAMDNLMPGFDKEIAKLAQRVLINPRKIDWHTGVLATKVTPGGLKLQFRWLLGYFKSIYRLTCEQGADKMESSKYMP